MHSWQFSNSFKHLIPSNFSLTGKLELLMYRRLSTTQQGRPDTRSQVVLNVNRIFKKGLTASQKKKKKHS